MASPLMEMIFELFLLGSVGVAGLQYLVSANMDGLNAAVVTILTVVIPLMFGIVVVYSWYERAGRSDRSNTHKNE